MRDFPGGPGIENSYDKMPMQGTWVQGLVGELKAHMPRGKPVLYNKRNLRTATREKPPGTSTRESPPHPQAMKTQCSQRKIKKLHMHYFT